MEISLKKLMRVGGGWIVFPGLALLTPLRAQPSPDATWTAAGAFASQYMFRGARLGGPSLQPYVEYDAGPLAAGVWSSWPVANKVSGQSDPEIDPYAWYKIPLTSAVSLQPGVTVYTFPRAHPSAGFYRATFEPNVAANWTVGGGTLTPKVYYDCVLHQTTLELNGAYALPVRAIGSELDFGATIGSFGAQRALADATPAVKGWGNYWLAGVTLPFQVTAHSRLSVGFAYTEGWGSFLKSGRAPRAANQAAASRGVFTLSYSFTR